MRLIDADAYAAEMKKRQDACMEAMENASYDGEQFSPKEHWEGVLAAFAEAKLTLDDMPIVGGWISVKDRLPEERQFVLVYGESLRPNKHNAACMAVSLRVDYNYWFGLGRTGAITHWMPLPEPPKEEFDGSD